MHLPVPSLVTARTKMSGIYLDHQATTPVDPRVVEAMRPYFTDFFGNAHASTYTRGLDARRATETARRKIADSIGAGAQDVIFTSGATEANNLAILGTAGAASQGRRRIITQATEHRSVLEPVSFLADHGFEVITIGVGSDGLLDMEELSQAVDKRTLVVSVMLVNNETGVIQPVEEIATICSGAGALLHSDCAQALGKVFFDVNDLKVDLASVSAHKIYGPKGIGGLYIRNLRRAAIRPIAFGGGQEGGLRPGTLPVPLCVGFGMAAEIAVTEHFEGSKRLSSLENRLWQGISDVAPRAKLNGHPTRRVPGCLSVHFPGCYADALIDAWQGIEVAKGSACEAIKTRSSHVLRAMGASRAQADSSIRMSVGRFTTENDIDEAIAIMNHAMSAFTVNGGS